MTKSIARHTAPPHRRTARPAQARCARARNGRQYSCSAREWTVKIEIYDQSYNVNAEDNEEYLQELAAYVDAKMRSIAESTHMVDSLKVAVLAALNIADESFTLRKRQQEIEGPLRKRVEKCVSMVEKALEQTN